MRRLAARLAWALAGESGRCPRCSRIDEELRAAGNTWQSRARRLADEVSRLKAERDA